MTIMPLVQPFSCALLQGKTSDTLQSGLCQGSVKYFTLRNLGYEYTLLLCTKFYIVLYATQQLR